MTSTPEDFDTWFSDTHGGTQKQPITSDELECDEVVEDDYSESSGTEEPPIEDGFSFRVQ